MIPTIKYLTVIEYADWKRVSLRTVRNEIKKGRIKAEKIGREYRIPVE
jgi:excisionase family DNA binding protein